MIRHAMIERVHGYHRPPADGAFYRPCRAPRIRRNLPAIALLIGLLAPPLARAQPAAQGDRERDRRTAALGHFEAGRREYQARRYRAAVRELELAHAAMPSADLLFDIARCHEELGENTRAIALYRRYLRDRVDAPDASEVRERIARLEAEERERQSRGSPVSQGRMRIDSNRPGALVSLGGSVIGATPIERTIALSPGQYRLEVTHPGYLPFVAAISVDAGALTVGYARLERVHRELEQDRASSAWPWVIGSLSAACLIASGVLAVLGVGAEDGGDRYPQAEWLLAGGVVLAFGAGTLAYGLAD
jgi:tetratricopeptide (TPR) repeat protein